MGNADNDGRDSPGQEAAILRALRGLALQEVWHLKTAVAMLEPASSNKFLTVCQPLDSEAFS